MAGVVTTAELELEAPIVQVGEVFEAVPLDRADALGQLAADPQMRARLLAVARERYGVDADGMFASACAEHDITVR